MFGARRIGGGKRGEEGEVEKVAVMRTKRFLQPILIKIIGMKRCLAGRKKKKRRGTGW